MTNEEHGQEFLQFVAKNEARLKKNLQKNITYNPDIFDDVFPFGRINRNVFHSPEDFAILGIRCSVEIHFRICKL